MSLGTPKFQQAHPNLYPLAGDDLRLTYSNRGVQIRVGLELADSLGNKQSARSFSDRSFFVDVRAGTSMIGRPGCRTGVPDSGNRWRKFRVVPRFHPLRPLFSTLFNGGGNRRAFSGDHFHCTVEPSSGHIRC